MTETSLEKLNQEAQGFPEKASGIVVHNNETLKVANNFLLGVKAMIKKIKETFDPIVDKAHKAHKEAVAQKKKFLDPLLKAEGEIKIRIASYMEEQEKKRREAERKAQEEEEKRLAAAQTLMDEASHLEEKGQAREAQEMRDRIPEQKAAIIPEVPVLNNVTTSKRWKWQVIDLSKVPVQFLQIDSGAVTKYVNAHKEQANIPGIRVFKETSVAARA